MVYSMCTHAYTHALMHSEYTVASGHACLHMHLCLRVSLLHALLISLGGNRYAPGVLGGWSLLGSPCSPVLSWMVCTIPTPEIHIHVHKCIHLLHRMYHSIYTCYRSAYRRPGVVQAHQLPSALLCSLEGVYTCSRDALIQCTNVYIYVHN